MRARRPALLPHPYWTLSEPPAQNAAAGDVRGDAKMARRYANSWSRAAARLTGVAHTQAPIFRWGVLIALVAVWIGLGLVFWLHLGVWEALYRTIAAVSMSGDYFGVTNEQLNLVRFAALAVPIVGL